MKIYIIMILEDVEANKFIYKGISTVGCDWQNITNMLHFSREFFFFFFHVIYKNYLFTINTLKLPCLNSSLMDSICTREPLKVSWSYNHHILLFFFFFFWLVDSGGGVRWSSNHQHEIHKECHYRWAITWTPWYSLFLFYEVIVNQ